MAETMTERSRDEIEDLKRGWASDPIWDIEDTEGFEAHREELLAFSKQKQDEWSGRADTASADGIIERIRREMIAGERTHGRFNSHHEAYAVLLEEVDEYWREIKRKNRTSGKMRDELIQIAAVAIRAAMRGDS